MAAFIAYDEDTKLAKTLALEVKKLETENILNAEKKAEEIVSYAASKLRDHIAKKKSKIMINIWKNRLASDARNAVNVLEKANALTTPSIGVRLADIAFNMLRLEKAFRENESNLSYWKTYYESVVAKWKFVETAEKYGMNIKDIHLITFKNPYVGTHTEEEAEMSIRYWTDQTDKIMINY